LPNFPLSIKSVKKIFTEQLYCDIMLGRIGSSNRSINSRENKGDRKAAIGKNSIFCKMLILLHEDGSISIDRVG